MKGYMTLIEAGEKWNVTPRLLNTYCLNGRIKGAERVGRAWVIPENANKPSDLRIKTGAYKGWRQKYNTKERGTIL